MSDDELATCPSCGAIEPCWDAKAAFDARDAIIEECARVVDAESSDCWEQDDTAGARDARDALAAAIRALKDKP